MSSRMSRGTINCSSYSTGDSYQMQYQNQAQQQQPQFDSVFASPAGSVNPVDWVGLAFQQIQLIKKEYLPSVITMYHTVRKQRLMASNDEVAIRLEKHKSALERTYKFLHLSPQALLICGKEKAYSGINYIIREFGRCKTWNSTPVLQAPSVEVVGNQYQAPQIEQMGNFVKFSDTSMPMYDPLVPGRQKMETSHCSGSSWVSPMISNLPRKEVGRASEAEILGGSSMGFHQRSYSSVSAVAQASVPASSSPSKPMDQAAHQLKTKQMYQKSNEDRHLKSSFSRIDQKWTAVPPSNSSPCTLPPQRLRPLDSPSKASISANNSSLSSSRPAVANPLTPLARSSTPTPTIPLQKASQREVIVDAEGLLKKTCSPADLTSSVEQDPSFAKKENPLKRLIDVVKSMSPAELKSAVRDMEAAIRDDDYMQSRRRKRKLDLMSSDDSTSCRGDGTEMLKKESHSFLLQEFEEIKQKLEVSLEVISMKEDLTPEDGILIRCFYVPVGFPDSSEQLFPSLSVDMMVTSDYPNSSPTILERMPPVCRADEDGIDLWQRAVSMLNLSLRRYSEPHSVLDVAEAWNDRARELFVEFAEQRGGGCFSSRYGKWDYCVAAV